jgi:Nucleotidyltransferase domain
VRAIASAPPGVARQALILNEFLRVVGTGGVLAVIIFGSVARDEADVQSDFDVLVVVEDHSVRTSILRTLGGRGVDAVCPLIITRNDLERGFSTRPSFVAHLLDEGLSVYETWGWQEIEISLQASASSVEALDAEVRQRTKELAPFAHPERFTSSPVTAMSYLYGVARALVIARLLQIGIHEYSWRRVFDLYADIRPELATELEILKGLRPYFERARARPGALLPKAPVTLEDLRQVVASIERLAA